METKAYKEGYEAYITMKGNAPYPNNGKAVNPYSENSSDYYDWIKGWNDRGRDDLYSSDENW